MAFQRNTERETRQRLAVFAEFRDFTKRVARSREKFFGLNVREVLRPAVSLNSSPTRSIEGCARFTDMRDHGISIEAGFGIPTTPITPACRRDFHRSPIVW